MDGDPPAGPPGPGPTAPGAEQGGGSGAAEGLLGDTPQPVTGATNAANEENPPPYSSPDLPNVHLIYPPFPAGFSRQAPIFYQPWPGPQPFAPGIPLAPLPSTLYNPQPSTIPVPTRCLEPLPRDYLEESVLVTIFCCPLSGILATIYSLKTRAALRRGDTIRADQASKNAEFLIACSKLLGCSIYLILFLYVLGYL